jgi:hypothetical protein
MDNLNKKFTEHVGEFSGLIINIAKDIIPKESKHSKQLIYRKILLLKFKSSSQNVEASSEEKNKKYSA